MNSVDPETHQDTESCPDDQQLRFRVPLCARVEWIWSASYGLVRPVQKRHWEALGEATDVWSATPSKI